MDSLKRQVRVAIIEDDEFYGSLIRRHVENHFRIVEPSFDAEIDLYSSSGDFFENLDKGMDILVMDYYVENDEGEVVIPGLEILRLVKNICSQCKVIVTSGQKNENVVMELYRNGISDYIVKSEDTLIRLTRALKEVTNELKKETLTIN